MQIQMKQRELTPCGYEAMNTTYILMRSGFIAWARMTRILTNIFIHFLFIMYLNQKKLK